MTHIIAKEELPHVVAKEELPYGTIAYRFEGHRYGDVDVSFFLVDSPPGGGAVLHTPTPTRRSSSPWRVRPPSPSETPPSRWGPAKSWWRLRKCPTSS